MKILLKISRSLKSGGWALLGIAALGLTASGMVNTPNAPAHASGTLEERKMPMRFSWVDCQPNCRGWISAVGIVTSDTPKAFDAFMRDRPVNGTTVVLDSSGGSVNDAISLGRRWRALGLATTVGVTIDAPQDGVMRTRVLPEAYCESMCVFLLLAGKTRYVPPGAHVRVHQIWMGDRADDARAATYSAQDLMIVERDIGRLAKYTFDMGGTGDLLALALSVPPWEDLHEMSVAEIKLGNLATTELLADVLSPGDPVAASVAELNARDQSAGSSMVKETGTRVAGAKPFQERLVSDTPTPVEPAPIGTKSTKTAEVGVAAPTSVATPAAR